MKKNTLVFTLILFAFFTGGCKLVDKLTQFTIPYKTSFTVSPISIIGLPIDTDFPTPEITTNAEQTFSSNKTAANLIEKVLLKKLELTITSPADKKFDFLSGAKVFLTAEGLSEIEVASISDIDDATVGNKIALTPTTKDLKDYLKKDKFTIKVRTTTDKTVTSDIDIDINASFFVDAKILGI